MIAEFGQFLINISMVLTLVMGVMLLIAAHYRYSALLLVGINSAWLFFIFITVSFIALIYSFATDDFSLSLVSHHSHSKQPLLYKIAATWGNHEGSLMLWVWVLSLMALLLRLLTPTMPLLLRARSLGVLLLISGAFLVFLIWTSNPFARLFPVPLEGAELNPLLQDPALALHPPMLYIGYVGLSVAFSIAIAGLLDKKIDIIWAHSLRPWVLLSWVFLTTGIALGSWWAYYELGWGGFWFWDPVENVSFMPWLLTTALIHCVIVVERRSMFKAWTVLLAICCFSFSLIGTFIVRSGVITSVHAFASDPERGLFILILLALIIGVSLIIYAYHAPALHGDGKFAFFSRETGLLCNNWLLVSATLIVFIGTLFPLFLEAVNGDKITVGPPYFNIAFTPIMMMLFVIMGIAPFLSWKRANIMQSLRVVSPPLVLSVAIAFIVAAFYDYARIAAFLGIMFGAWLITSGLYDVVHHARAYGRQAFSWQRVKHMPMARFGMVCAHSAMGVITIGAVGASALSQDAIIRLSLNTPYQFIDDYTLTLRDTAIINGPNWQGKQALLEVRLPNGGHYNATPHTRIYVSGRDTSEVDFKHFLSGDLYIAASNIDMVTKQATINIYYKPFAWALWLGALLLVLGGLLALADKKLYIGARTSRNNSKPQGSNA